MDTITVTGNLLHIFSRKERAKRKRQSHEPEHLGLLPVSAHPGPRSTHPRPLSSFAPAPTSHPQSRRGHGGFLYELGLGVGDGVGVRVGQGGSGGYSASSQARQASSSSSTSTSNSNSTGTASQQYYYARERRSGPHQQEYHHQHPYHHHEHHNAMPPPQQSYPPSRASVDLSGGYPALPTYDPSKYPPIQPSFTDSTVDSFAWHHHLPGQSSRLSEVHYHDARPSSMYFQPPRVPNLCAAPPLPQLQPPSQPQSRAVRNQPTVASSHHPNMGSTEHHRSSRPGDGRERSFSEPMPAAAAGQSSRGPRRAKPVLSRLITNF
ncbi:hypothetical protein N7539_006660 [Penicillium diatomitis]|uniref:Uncharacterized protein n=1 Tax=Penicillium diatomitis TaxID=2819901 RepID=A0A9W9X2U4_9EURO|nr:uncharacterized protein N7539_006660 [Penicillium diatomitis]KAJ5480766.1 hypothetical protein N7539_006660 [Penicillium diatomitis]